VSCLLCSFFFPSPFLKAAAMAQTVRRRKNPRVGIKFIIAAIGVGTAFHKELNLLFSLPSA
jgi:hypothetical protein